MGSSAKIRHRRQRRSIARERKRQQAWRWFIDSLAQLAQGLKIRRRYPLGVTIVRKGPTP